MESIRKLFKFLEYTAKRKQFPLEKLRRVEKANIKVNSESFEDPADVVAKEETRLKDAEISPSDSGLNYY